MESWINNLLLHPDAFFAHITGERDNLVPPLAIVGVSAAVSFTVMIIGTLLVSNSLDVTTIPILFEWFFVLPFIAWGIFSGVLFLISFLFSGKGSLIATLQNVGYGVLPLALINPVTVLGRLLFFRTSHVVYSTLYYNPQFFSIVVFLLLFLWSCYLWVYAIKHTHKFSVKRSIAAVIVSVVIVFIVELYGPLFLYGPLPL
jgi:hypothetical protein